MSTSTMQAFEQALNCLDIDEIRLHLQNGVDPNAMMVGKGPANNALLKLMERCKYTVNTGLIMEVYQALVGAGARTNEYVLRYLVLEPTPIELFEAIADHSATDEKKLLSKESVMLAISRGRVDILKAQQRRGADILAVRINETTTPLHAAAQVANGTSDVVAWLLELGHNPNLKNNLGYTPLHSCTHIPTIQQLLAAGSDPNAVDVFGQTPLFLAETPDIVDVLLEAGAKSDHLDEHQLGPLYHAWRNSLTTPDTVVVEHMMALDFSSFDPHTHLDFDINILEPHELKHALRNIARMDSYHQRQKLTEISGPTPNPSTRPLKM